MEKKEKERKRIKVSAEVQQKVAEQAGVKLEDLAAAPAPVMPEQHSAVQSPISAADDAAVLSPESVALDLGMQQHQGCNLIDINVGPSFGPKTGPRFSYPRQYE